MTAYVKGVDFVEAGGITECQITLTTMPSISRSVHTLPEEFRDALKEWVNAPKRMPWPYADEDLNGVAEDKATGWHESSGR